MPYDAAYFNNLRGGSQLSAQRVVPALLELFDPTSVVDLGCGTGAWVSVFKKHGVGDFLGIDGDYVDPAALLIPTSRFQAADLSQPLRLCRQFDLALSIEVAEHLPASAAETFIDNLVSLSDAVVFSAAIPGQGGTHHINEQWPEYWKIKFERRSYQLLDCLRMRFWHDPDVAPWYRQNLLIYVHDRRLNADPQLRDLYEKSRLSLVSVVHPTVYLEPSLRAIARMIPQAFSRSLRRRFGQT